MLEMLKTLCDIDAVSSDEDNLRDFILNEIQEYADDIKIDNLGNLIVFKKGKNTRKQKVLVSAHLDEVGFIVKNITDTGLIKFGFCGGIDSSILLGQKVRFKSGILGVIGIKAVHLTGIEERKVAPKDFYVDIGATSKTQALSKVNLGEFFTFYNDSFVFGDGFLKSKAIDDRFGCALMINLIKSELLYDTIFAFNTQEEVGLRGARTSSFIVEPDVSIVLETTTAQDLSDVLNHKKVCKLGGGVVIPFMDRATIYNKDLLDKAYDICKKHNILYQTKTVIAGGNDSGAISLTKSGVKTINFSIGARYLHSASTVIKLSDIDEVLKLTKLFLEEEVL